MLRVLGLAVLSAVLLYLLRDMGGRLVPLGAAAGGILLLLYGVLRYGELLSLFSSLGEVGEVASSAISLSLRAVGLASVTEITAGICRDLGEGGLATKVEWCGRAEILAVSLPTLRTLLSLASGYLA
ncbi:MAG: hypothetical protein IKC73_03645 [Clostridia bacterium]|nr:hypothetical protein [Clostridia bacterium]